MADNDKAVEAIKKPKTAQEFAEAYQQLCDEYGFRVVVTPVWIARDDGSWSTTLQTSVGQLPKVE